MEWFYLALVKIKYPPHFRSPRNFDAVLGLYRTGKLHLAAGVGYISLVRSKSGQSLSSFISVRPPIIPYYYHGCLYYTLHYITLHYIVLCDCTATVLYYIGRSVSRIIARSWSIGAWTISTCSLVASIPTTELSGIFLNQTPRYSLLLNGRTGHQRNFAIRLLRMRVLMTLVRGSVRGTNVIFGIFLRIHITLRQRRSWPSSPVCSSSSQRFV